VAKAIEFNMQR